MKLQITLLSILLIIISILTFETFKPHPTPIAADKKIVINQNLQVSPATQSVLAACTGLTSTTKPADLKYALTAFGCYIDTNGNRNNQDTPGCTTACSGDQPPECQGLDAVECMYKLKWFAANADQFTTTSNWEDGCNKRLRVTDTASGKAVVVVVYDRGPHCNEVTTHGEILDVSYPTAMYLGGGNYETVQVEEVPENTPLGPTDGSSPTSSTGTGGNFNASQTLTLKLRPLKEANNSYIKNEITAQVFGAKNGSGTSSNPGAIGLPGEPLPEGGIAEIETQLCIKYDVCPNENLFDPGGEWTMPQITALWNVVQKIYESPVYRKHAIGNNILEITKTECLPGGCSGYWGYYAGLSPDFTAFHNLSGSRLVIMSAETPGDGPVGLIEWLLAHEIGHGASGGTPEGGTLDCLACNEPAKKMIACATPISTYSTDKEGRIVDQEYVAEAISYYMTDAEQVRDNYNGSTGNMKTDFPCLYNAAKELFGGVEY